MLLVTEMYTRDVVKPVLVVAKNSEWWLKPTTADQCGQNPVLRNRAMWADIITTVSCFYDQQKRFNSNMSQSLSASSNIAT